MGPRTRDLMVLWLRQQRVKSARCGTSKRPLLGMVANGGFSARRQRNPQNLSRAMAKLARDPTSETALWRARDD